MDYQRLELPQLLEMALQHHRSGEFADAEGLYRLMMSFAPDCFDAWHLLGVLARQTGRLNEAIELISRAVALNDQEPAAFNNLGVAFQAAGLHGEAEIRYRQALALRTDYADAHYNLGVVLAVTGRYAEAELSYRKALEFKPDGVEACNNLAATLRELGRAEEAVELYRKAIGLRPSSDIYGNLAATLRVIGRVKEAEEAYQKAIALDPDFLDAQHNLSLVQLLQGDYDEGFARNEFRFAVGTGKRYQELVLSRFSAHSRWRGELLAGRRLMVVTEQGLGDNLMMMRYLPLLREQKVERLMVCCHRPSLRRIMQTIPGIDDVLLLEDVAQVEDNYLFCPIMSLPYLMGTCLDSIPQKIPYLTPPPEMRDSWRRRLDGMKGVKVGLAWAGCSLNQDDASRSIPLKFFAPLMTLEGIRFVSLQQDEAALQLKGLGWEMVCWMDDCPDLLDTAAMVGELDLVITVDTAMAHLAGALGTPVWLLNRLSSEWRWMMGRDDSPWYPSMKIFRQPQRGDWDSVIQHVAGELRQVSSESLRGTK